MPREVDTVSPEGSDEETGTMSDEGKGDTTETENHMDGNDDSEDFDQDSIRKLWLSK